MKSSEKGRVVRLFRNGRNQAVRIPRDLELSGSAALLYREGHRLVPEPLRPRGLLSFLDQLEPISDELPDVDDDLLGLDDIEA